MKHRSRSRPIGKCKGCALNLRTLCAAGLEPKAEWDRGRCRARDDEAVLERFCQPERLSGEKAARHSRRAKAALSKTVPHYDGHVFAPARQGGPAK